MPKIVIIGGGASGLAAAIRASDNPQNQILLFERQERVGRKLLSTGNGRCNLTNTAAAPKNYHGGIPTFILPTLRKYPPARILDFFSSLGLLTIEEYGGRVYPMSGHAASVLDVLRLALDRKNITLYTATPILSIQKHSSHAFQLIYDGGSQLAEKVIVACGSCASGKLGGVMDGYTLLESLGHSRTALYPALTQIRTVPDYPRAMKGIKADVQLRLEENGRLLGQRSGDLLFTDTGVSGTAAFSLSRLAAQNTNHSELSIDLFYNLTTPALHQYLEARRQAHPNLEAGRIFSGSVHSRIGLALCKYAQISPVTPLHSLSKQQLHLLVRTSKDFRLKVTGVSGFENAQVTAGGISTAEFDPHTLESRLVSGLFACGELLDVDGDCGGFNLQWAWSSGLLAGELGKSAK